MKRTGWIHILFAFVFFISMEGVSLCQNSRVPSAQGNTSIIYIGGGLVYFDKGTLDGLETGNTVTMMTGESRNTLEINWTGDHRAAAVIPDGNVRLKVGQSGNYTYRSEEQDLGPVVQTQHELPSRTDAELLQSWGDVAGRERPRIRYQSEQSPVDRVRSDANILIGTHYRARIWSGNNRFASHEQRIFLFAKGKNLGVEGFGLRIRGRVDVRYDSETDRYLAGERALPVIREFAFTYESSETGVFLLFGRLHPNSFIANLADGAELGWGNELATLSAYGGLNPDGLDLLPRVSHQLYGFVLDIHPDFKLVDWHLGAEYAGESSNKESTRNALGLSTELAWQKRIQVNFASVVDFVKSGDVALGSTGPALSLISASLDSQPHEVVGLHFLSRYIKPSLFLEATDDLPTQWLQYLEGREHLRLEGGPSFNIDSNREIDLSIFWDRKQYQTAARDAWLGGEITYRERDVGNLPFNIDFSLSYAGWLGHQAGFDFNLNGSILNNRLWLTGGVANLWSLTLESGNHTVRHSPYFRITGKPYEGLSLSLIVYAGFEYGFVREQIPFGSWHLVQGEISYSW